MEDTPQTGTSLDMEGSGDVSMSTTTIAQWTSSADQGHTAELVEGRDGLAIPRQLRSVISTTEAV